MCLLYSQVICPQDGSAVTKGLTRTRRQECFPHCVQSTVAAPDFLASSECKAASIVRLSFAGTAVLLIVLMYYASTYLVCIYVYIYYVIYSEVYYIYCSQHTS